jgi:hypothetical protein
VTDIAKTLAGESKKLSTNDRPAANSGTEHHSKQMGDTAPSSESVFGERGGVRVDFQMTTQLEAFLESASKRKIAQRTKICVRYHHRVLTIEKSGDRNSDRRNLISLVSYRVYHRPQLGGDRIYELVRLRTGVRGNRRSTEYSPVLANYADLCVGSPDVDGSSQAHQRPAFASSGFFQRSIGLTIPFGLKGMLIFLPSPAEAYAA